MSAHRLSLTLSQEALRDYEDVLLYSVQTWGEQQKDAYKMMLDRTLAELGDYPEIGRPRTDIHSGYRSRSVGQHVIFYRIESSAIRVIRILHAKQDPTREIRHSEDLET
jgi:toxin ParE1/3/4